MYSKSYEQYMQEFMSGLENVNTSEGSLAWNACSRMAVLLEEFSAILDGIDKNMYADTSDIEHLMREGNTRGIIRKTATFALFKAVFNMQVPAGTVFTNDIYDFTVFSEMEEENTYLIGCNTAGKAPNGSRGNIYPVNFIDGFETGNIVSVITEGTDEESEEVYRTRVVRGYDPIGYAGNRAYYKSQIKQLDGVGGVKLERVNAPGDYITAIVISDTFRAPSAEKIRAIKELVDPFNNEGEGYGYAPIGHKVNVVAVQEHVIDISFNIIFEDGYNYETLKSNIQEKIEEYFSSVCANWENATSLTVRILQIEASLLNIQGIVDVTSTLLNSQAGNIIIENKIPVLGVVTCHT